MDKSIARALVHAEMNAQVNKYSKQNKIYVHTNQIQKAEEIVDAFHSHISLVVFIASPQWGKTGVTIHAMYLMTTHINESLMIHPEHVFIITGMSDKDWEVQMKSRMLPSFKERVYHRNNLKKMIDTLKTSRDCLIIIDECHYGSETNQTLHKCMRDAGIWNIDYLQERNIKILCVSATPVNVQLDAAQWGPTHYKTIIASGMDTSSYIGFHTLLAEKRICKAYIAKDAIQNALGNTDATNTHKILATIAKRWNDCYRYHIFRISDSMRKKSDIEKHIKAAGYIVSFHDSRERIKDIDTILEIEPTNHHFIFIKQFWKASKTLNDKYIGVCYEYTRDYTSAAQGLGGRLLGFGKQSGPQSPLLYCIPSIIEGYIKWFNNDCNYLLAKSYNSSSLKIKDGKIIKQKQSVVNATNIENLVPEEHNQNIYVPDKKSYLEPKRIGVITMEQITNGEMGYIQLASSYEILTLAEFNTKFFTNTSLLTQMPENADALSKLLKTNSISANVSYSNNSAKSVSNLVNYYKHANWAESNYHIIYIVDTTTSYVPDVHNKNIVVITRNKELLNNAKMGTSIATHNSDGQIILYQC